MFWLRTLKFKIWKLEANARVEKAIKLFKSKFELNKELVLYTHVSNYDRYEEYIIYKITKSACNCWDCGDNYREKVIYTSSYDTFISQLHIFLSGIEYWKSSIKPVTPITKALSKKK